jgi:hypothetical protein
VTGTGDARRVDMAYPPMQTPITDQDNAHRIFPMPAAETPRQAQVTASLVAGGSTAELAGGVAAIVLSVIGLAQAWPLLMAELATLAAGTGLLVQGTAVAARWRYLVRGLYGSDEGLVGGGVGLAVAGGLATVVLSVLALAGVMPSGMVAVAAIVLGGSMVVAGAVPPQLAVATSERDVDLEQRLRRVLVLGAGALVLCGLAAALLGIFGMIGVGSPVTMALVAMLVAGVALLVAGGASAFKFARALAA